jgi:multiple sugar transport system substrate-binding protein
MCTFYARDVFDEAGIDYPPNDPDEAWTWDEFVDVCIKLTKDANGLTPADEGFDPENIVRYGVNASMWWPIWGSFILSNGGQIVDEDGNFAMNQPAAVEALQKVCDLKNVQHVAPTVTASESLPSSDVALLTGTYAMVIGGQWSALTYADAGVNFGMAPIPRMGDEVVSVCTNGMYCIFSASEEKEAAWELIQYFNDPSLDLTLYKNGNRMPSSKAWLTDPELMDLWMGEGNPARPEPFDGVIEMLIDHSVAPLTGLIVGFPDLINLIDAGVSEVVYGNMTAQEAMDMVAQQVIDGELQIGLRDF